MTAARYTDGRVLWKTLWQDNMLHWWQGVGAGVWQDSTLIPAVCVFCFLQLSEDIYACSKLILETAPHYCEIFVSSPCEKFCKYYQFVIRDDAISLRRIKKKVSSASWSISVTSFYFLYLSLYIHNELIFSLNIFLLFPISQYKYDEQIFPLSKYIYIAHVSSLAICL